MNTAAKTAILTGVGLVVGVGEALLYHNMGLASATGEGFKYKMPPRKEFWKTVGVVAISSLITAGLFAVVENVLDSPEDRDKRLASSK